MNHIDQEYNDILDYLYYEIGHFNVKLGLENITELLNRWGNPQNNFLSVHVAGTNGKGSVCAVAFSLLRTQGYRVGMLTSPHLVDFRERIRFNEQFIPKEKVVELVKKLRPDVDEIGATYFEILTVMAYLYFTEQNADYAVIEVGMGGRLDATRILKPAVSIITNISLEHTRHLGDTVEKIAFEKGGIIKPNVPVITADQQVGVLDVLQRICDEQQTTLIKLQDVAKWSNIRLSPEKTTFDYTSSQIEIENLESVLLGRHQVVNIATALTAVFQIPTLTWNVENIRQGLAQTQWHGRLQILQREPWIVVDGAHNPAGMVILRDTLQEMFTYRRLIFIFGVLKGKAFQEMLPHIEAIADEIIVTQAANTRSVDYQLLAEDVSFAVSIPTIGVASVAESIQIALCKAAPEDLICIAGSLYIVGEALEYTGQTPERLL